ncbi:hypothetical protein AYI70_g10490, partial [Smittium culicis]
PCTAVDVDIELNVDTQDDLYIMLTGNDSYSPSDNVIEIALKFSSKVYEINEDVLAQSSYTTASPGSNKSFVGKIRVIYNGYFVGVYINGVGKASYIIENSEFKGMYVTPSAGKVEVSKGFLNIQCANGCQASVDSSSLHSSSTSSMSFFELFSASPFISSQISVDPTFSSHTCDSTSSFMNLSVTSSPNIKMYDFNAPILVPCSNSDFQLDFDLVSDSDLFVAITDLAGFSSSFGYSESSFGFSSGNYLIKRYPSYDNTNITTAVTQPSYSGHLTLKYSNQILSLYDSYEFEASYKIKNLDLKQIFISPLTGRAEILNGIFTCSSTIKC